MRRALLLLVMLLGACATADAPPPGVEPVQVASARVGDLIGRTQSEVRAALGRPVDEGLFYVRKVRLEQGVRVAEVFGPHFLRPDACPRGYHFNIGSGFYEFRDERLAGVQRGRTDLTADDTITVECSPLRGRRGGNATEEAVLGVGALAIYGPLMPLHAVAMGIDSTMDESDERPIALAALRLGEAPEGGLDAYLARYGHLLYLRSRDGDDAHISLARYEDGRDGLIEVEVRDGVVESLEAGYHLPCALAPDYSLRCMRGAP